MNQKKALEKIRKCLALAKSANTHEAAAALRQAQALMKKYDLSEKDIEGAKAAFSEWQSPYRGTEFAVSELMLIGAVIKTFGVRGICVFSRDTNGRPRKTMRFAGTEGREQLARWALTVLMRAMNSAWLEYREKNVVFKGQMLDRESFRVGWATAVEKQIEALALTEKQQAIIEAGLESNTKGMTVASMKVKENDLDLETANAGFKEGSKFRLNRPVGVDPSQPAGEATQIGYEGVVR